MWTTYDQQAWTAAIPGQDGGVCRALVLHWLSMSTPGAVAMNAANLASVQTIMTARRMKQRFAITESPWVSPGWDNPTATQRVGQKVMPHLTWLIAS